LGDDPLKAVQILQALLAFVAVSLVWLGATLSEREEAHTSLAEAQELAPLGSWEWDIDADRMTWSPELCRIFQVAPASRPKTLAAVLARVHPSDRDTWRAAVDRALELRRPFEIVHRVV